MVGDFPLGVKEVMQLRPRLFRYNGLAGTKADGALYVGLIAQELPEALAPYCCVKAEVLLRPTDSVPTEILMLDHSCFPLLCVNALQQHEQRLHAVECAVGAVAEQLRELESLGAPSERAAAWA